MRDPNRTQTHAEALAYHARQVKIAGILAEIAEGSMVDAVSVDDIALAREVIAAGKGAVTWSTAGESWARLCKAQSGSVYPPL